MTIAPSNDETAPSGPQNGARSDSTNALTSPRKAEQWPNGQPDAAPYRHPQEGGDFVG